MRWFAGFLIASCSAAMLHAGDPVGVYGYIQKVVTEPNAEKPERVQIWGTFSVAAPGPGDNYQAPERGYLYFALPQDSAAGAEECRKLQGTIGKIGVVAFSRRGAPARVRTEAEAPAQPTPYNFGTAVELVDFDRGSPAVRALGRLPKVIGLEGYGLVDKIVLEPDSGKPQRIQIWGVFAMGNARLSSYATPQKGYLYVTLPSPEWADWKLITESPQLLGFRSPFHLKLRVRTPGEKPEAPDTLEAYRAPLVLFAVRRDTEYAPVRALLASR